MIMVAMKDNFQAKATLQSIIENYKGNDDILSTAQQKLDSISPGRKSKPTKKTDTTTTVAVAQPDTTKN